MKNNKLYTIIVVNLCLGLLGLSIDKAQAGPLDFLQGKFNSARASFTDIPDQAKPSQVTLQNPENFTKLLVILGAIKSLITDPSINNPIQIKIMTDTSTKTPLQLALTKGAPIVVATIGLYIRALQQTISVDKIRAAGSVGNMRQFLTKVNDMQPEQAMEHLESIIRIYNNGGAPDRLRPACQKAIRTIISQNIK